MKDQDVMDTSENGISNLYIEQILNSLPIAFDGVFSCDNIPTQITDKSTYIIICNLSKENEKGTHFITLAKVGEKHFYLFDSLALELHLLPYQIRVLIPKHVKIVCKTNIQPIISSFCGFYCVYFVLFLNLKNDHYKFRPNMFSNINTNDRKCITTITNMIKNL